MRDRRRTQRQPAYLGGTISFNHRLSEAECVVRNTSAGGARLELTTPFVPNEFDLVIPKRQAECRVRVMWRRDEQIGVEIAEDTAAEQPLTPAQAKQFERLERENRNLRHQLGMSDLR